MTCFCAKADEQPQKIYRIAFVGATSPAAFPRSLTVFWDRLRELGYVEGQNLVIESRWAQGHPDRLPTLMSEVVQRKVDVIVTYGTPAAISAKRATVTIPIFNIAMGDPVGTGLVSSLARPGGPDYLVGLQKNRLRNGQTRGLGQPLDVRPRRTLSTVRQGSSPRLT